MRHRMLAPALIVVFALAACTPTPTATPAPTASALPSAGESASASPSPSPAFAVPDCDDIYTPLLISTLVAEGRTPLGDTSTAVGGGWGTFDAGIETILSAIKDRISCTWVLPTSESGSTTSVAVLDAASRTALVAAFAAGGFTASTTSSGDLFTLSVEADFLTYTESHLITAEVWIGSVYAFGDADILTLDAAVAVLP
jgi:hypothetical protein